MDKIVIDINDKVAWITINNPDKLNCLDMGMLQLLKSGLEKISTQNSARVLVIRGKGEKAFSTGANLKEFAGLDHDGVTHWIKYGNEVFNFLESMHIPSVAIINGYALGGGLELALSCDLRIATNYAKFSFPELKHGWLPGWGGMTRLKRLIGESRAKELIMLGEMIDADNALQMGLINRLCSVENLEEQSGQIIKNLIEVDPLVMEMAKKSLSDTYQNSNEKDGSRESEDRSIR